MPTPANKKVPIRTGALAFANLIKALIPGDMNCHELAEESGLTYLTVLHHCRALHKVGAIHIARRDPDSWGRHNILVYKLGAGKDAPRVRLSRSEHNQRYRAKVKAAAVIAMTAGRTSRDYAGRIVAEAA